MGKLVKKVERVRKVNLLDLEVANGMYWVRVNNGGVVHYQKIEVNN
jgi:hypothetical protein